MLRNLRLAWATATILLYLAVCLYPFKFDPVRNGAVFKAGEELSFSSRGLARSIQPPDWLDPVIEDSALEIELEFAASSSLQSGPARIFSISKDKYSRNLTFGQENSDLVIRVRRPSSNFNGTPPYVIPGVFENGGWHRVALKIRPSTIHIVVDDRTVVQEHFEAQTLKTWDPSFGVVFGNEVGGVRPWLGTIRKATVRFRGKEIDYVSSHILDIPRYYWRFEEATTDNSIVPRFQQFWARPLNIRDLIGNYLGFIPLGGVVFLLLSKRNSLAGAAIICALTSLFIESSQIFLVDRFPQLTDLFFNCLGGLSGAVIARSVLERLTRK